MKRALDILRQYWKYESFRPLQEDIINAVLDGKDVLALMPTGGGKSLCYQVPVMMRPGLGLVVSPLIALMKDQVEGLRKKGITAFAVYSGMSRKELVQTLRIASESNCKFLYVSPERLETRIFKEYLPGLNINLVAVDEAHCISQWGYDFRPSYLKIAAIREELPGVPLLALTASATSGVQKDICEKLAAPPILTQKNKEGWKIFRQSFERSNLSYSVFHTDSKVNKIIDIIQKVHGSSIVYCKSRKRTKEIAGLLQLQKISSGFYHAGLTSDERSKKQEDWINNRVRVIVCTNAFGMGIDKPDVRLVIHADVPDCLENYYQEAGRAGRDSKRSYAVLLYDDRELEELKNLPDVRYPGLEELRQTYQSVVNYLQIPSGGPEGEYYEFDLPDFLKKFKLEGIAVFSTLKVLEQEGWLAFNEQVFLPSFAGFTCDKERLYSFENENPLFEPLLKSLLRTYEGIFDQPVAISEKILAGLLRKELEEIKKLLGLLAQAGIIDYRPQKEKPQIVLLRNRIRSEDLTIDMTAYKKRKEQFEKRLRQLIGFVQEEHKCRSRLIGLYFGDEDLKDCGICDNCLRIKNASIEKAEFETFRKNIIASLAEKPLPVKELTGNIPGTQKEKTWKMLEFLLSENIITISEEGEINLRT